MKYASNGDMLKRKLSKNFVIHIKRAVLQNPDCHFSHDNNVKQLFRLYIYNSYRIFQFRQISPVRSMNQVSYYSIGNDIHDHGCHDNARQELPEIDFLISTLQQRSDQSSCPCPCSRKRNSHEQHQPPELIFLYLIALSHCPVFQIRINQSTEQFRLLHHLENLSDEKQNKRNGDNISDHTQRNCLCRRYFQQGMLPSSPPLNSRSGIMEIINTAPSGEIYCDRLWENQCTSASIKPPISDNLSKQSINFCISSLCSNGNTKEIVLYCPFRKISHINMLFPQCFKKFISQGRSHEMQK